MRKTQAQPSTSFSRFTLILGVIFFVALFFRFIHLGQTPIGFHVDEVDAGYIGRYILLHGKDVVGHVLPFYFDKFGDFRPTGIFYLSGLSTFVFGLTEFAVRFPSACLGALSVIPLYLLATELFRKKSVGLIAAGILAVLPWHVVLSRATSESIVGLCLLLFGLWYMLRALREERPRLFLVGSLFLLLTYAFYHTFRALVPVICLPLFLKAHTPRMRKLLIGVIGLFFLITIGLSFTHVGSGRLNQVVFYKNPDLQHVMTALLTGSKGSIFLTRIFHNKPVLYVREYVRLYVSYYSLNFLFLTGGYPDRYRIPEQGLFYITLLPMLFIGLCSMIYKKEQTSSLFFIFFLLIVATLPASLTYEDAPNVQRAVLLILPLVLLMAYGIDQSISWLFKKNWVGYGASMLIGVIFLFEVSLFSYMYFVHADSYKSVYRNDGNRELFRRVKELYPTYDHIVMSGYDELPTYAAFYMNYFDSFPAQLYSPNIGETHMGKIIFVENKCPLTFYKKKLTGKVAFINYDSFECSVRPGVVEQQAVQRSDSTNAYRIYVTQ